MIESLLTPTHILLILAVALIVLGPKRLPEAGRGLGSAIRGFKDSLSTAEHREEHVSTHLGRALCGPLEECGQIGKRHARPGFVVGGRDASWQSLIND